MSVLRLIPLKGEAIVVDADEALVGREASCNVLVAHPSVSRKHALLKRKQDVFFVVDQGSANGTFVDSKRVVDATLKDGCVLRFGSATFKVEIADEAVVESIGEEELVVAPTMIAQQSFSATVLEGAALSDDSPTPHYGTDLRGASDDVAPTIQAEALSRSKPVETRRPAAPPVASVPVASPAPPPPPALPAAAATPKKGPAFWLMVGAGVLALLFVGAALALLAVFAAKRLGYL